MLAEHQEKVITDYQETLDELERSREQLEEKRTEINQLIGKAHDKEQELVDTRKKEPVPDQPDQPEPTNL